MPNPSRRDRHELVRQANVETMCRAIAQHAPVTRSRLVQLTGLSKPTVLRLVTALELEGLIRQVPRTANRHRRAGRTPLHFELNPAAGHVIGVDVSGTRIAVALAQLTGPLVAESEDAITCGTAEGIVDQLIELVRRIARESDVPWADVRAVAVGLPGALDLDGTAGPAGAGTTSTGLAPPHVAEQLEQALSLPVQLDSDVNLAALGELEEGVARSCRNFALLSLGTRAGLGLVIDGRLARGAQGRAGQVAYLPIGIDPAEHEPRQRGAFEAAAAADGMTTMLVAELDRAAGTPEAGRTRLGPRSTAHHIYAAAGEGDPIARRVIERQAELVAQAILSISCLVDPELVVLGGRIGGQQLLLGPVIRAVDRIVPWPVLVETSTLGRAAGVVGALHLARRAVPRVEAARVSARFQRLGLEGPPA